MLLDAFQAMDIGERGPPLIPPGQPLDLFVTVTDLAGYPEQLSLHSPPRVEEPEHRLVISFSGHSKGDLPLGATPEDPNSVVLCKCVSVRFDLCCSRFLNINTFFLFFFFFFS